MGDLHEPDTRFATSPAQPNTADRRRPGRPQNVSPALLPLLRAPHGTTDALNSAALTDAAVAVDEMLPVSDRSDYDDYSRPFHGICVSFLLVSPFWAAFFYFVLR